MVSKQTGTGLLLALTALIVLAAVLLPRVAQPLSCHHLADGRSELGSADFQNVASNLVFAIFGAWGLWFLAQKDSSKAFLDPRECWPYLTFFIGMLLTAFGSGYYHLMPDNSRLVWDRLPMIIAFMSLVSAMIAERLDVTIGVRLLLPLLCLGIFGVIQWHLSEQRGHGDLRFYAAVQLHAVAVLLLLLLLPPRYIRTSDLVWLAAYYLLAKVFEATDRSVFSMGHLVSGHTLKHLAAGMSGYFLLRMLRNRLPIPAQVQTSHAA